MIDETFLTTEEVLEYLQVNLRTVYRLIKAGKNPAVRVGREWTFSKPQNHRMPEPQPPPGPNRRGGPGDTLSSAGRGAFVALAPPPGRVTWP